MDGKLLKLQLTLADRDYRCRKISPNQKAVLVELILHQHDNISSVKNDDISEHTGLCFERVRNSLKILEMKGYIKFIGKEKKIKCYLILVGDTEIKK